MDGYRRLVVFSGREHLAVLGRDSGVFRDQRRHHTAHGFDTQRQRGNVQQQYVFYVTSQNTTLNSSTDCYSFVRVNVFTRLFTKELSNFLLNHWHTSLTTNEDNVVDIRYGQASVLQCNFQRSMERFTRSSTRLSSFARVTLMFMCFGPVASAVMYGRLTSVC